MGKYKKQVKAEVTAAQKEVDANLDVDLKTLAKSQSTRKEIRKEAKKRRKNKSDITRKGAKNKARAKTDLDEKTINWLNNDYDPTIMFKDMKGRIRMVTKSDIIRTESPLAKYKCGYNSKKKK